MNNPWLNLPLADYEGHMKSSGVQQLGAGVGRCLENALSLVAPGGAISVVLQLPSEAESEQEIGTSPFLSIRRLKSHFSLIDAVWFRETLEARKFRMVYDARRSLPADKGFWMGVFSREQLER